jgi:hypothetical protein
MFAIAFLIGLYANCIFLLGLSHLLYGSVLLAFTSLYIAGAILFWNKFDEKIEWKKIKEEIIHQTQQNRLYVIGIVVSIIIMLLGTLVPETAFDALWYHLTLPKLYLQFADIHFFSGNLFYYSAMPKVGEMLYLAALSFGSDILAHLIHFSFVLLIGVVIYYLTRKYTSKYIAIIAVVIFLSNIVVLWEATTAYIDLIRTFFEVMTLWGLLNYLEKKNTKWLIESAFLFGIAIETKLLAFASLPIFLTLIIMFGFKKLKGRLIDALMFGLLAVLVPLAWFIFAYLNTGNPIYPFLTSYTFSIGKDTLAFPQTITDLVTVFVVSADPVSPIYLMLIPLFFIAWNKFKKIDVMLIVLSAVSLIIWTLTPKTGGGRFILPYLPLLSITAGIILFRIEKERILFRISILCVLIVFFISLCYRGVAEVRNLPVILGLESRDTYLTDHLNFNFGDFYDTDQKIKEIVGIDKTVLLYGFHNLYYMDVPFIDASFAKKSDSFDFIATQHTKLPKRFRYWQPVYYNPTTDVTLYSMGQKWEY